MNKRQVPEFVLAVTGTPAAGKSTLAKRLSKDLDARLIDLSKLAHERGIDKAQDRKRDARIIDARILKRELKAEIDGDAVLDGLMSHLVCPTHILVLRCDPRVLQKRMVERGYGRQKIMENLQAEYLSVILVESLKRSKNVLEVDNTRGTDIRRIKRWLKVGGRDVKYIDWTRQFEQVLKTMFPSPR
jgi:adenylate kinase